MNVYKKLGALTVVIVLAMSFCVMASADTTDATGTIAANGVEKTFQDNKLQGLTATVTFPKEFTVYGTNSAVYYPTVPYAYTIAPASVSNITVTDFESHPAPVKAPPAGTATISGGTFASAAINLSGEGETKSATASADITVEITLNDFAATAYGPGVYRYVIQDITPAADLKAAGITRSNNYEDTRYLDVYIRYSEDDTPALEVYGFVLLDENKSVFGDIADALKVDTTKGGNYVSTKSQGFKATYENADEYHTIDVTLTNVVTGAMGNREHQFPFAINVNNSAATNFYYRKGATGDFTAITGTALNASSSTTTLSNGEYYTLKGLNPNASITYTETNDTVDEYTLSVTDGDTPTAGAVKDVSNANITDKAIAAGGSQATGTLYVSNYGNGEATVIASAPTATVNTAITFTNLLNAISPTGVALRYAPYFLTMGAGLVALPLTKSYRKREDF